MDPTDRLTLTSSRRRAPARRLRSSLAVVALAAASAQLALGSTASACNEYVYARRVAAVAPTGAIIEVVADAMLGLSRARLADRLARRERVFTRRGRPALAEEARAGRAWLATLAP